MFIDNHCHVLGEYYDNIDEVIKKCKAAKVEKIIVSGTNIKTNREVLELVNKYDIVYGTIGFHPTELDDFTDTYFAWLEANINNKKIIGIGEIGLDYHYPDIDKEKQKELFIKQLQIAKKYNKPILLIEPYGSNRIPNDVEINANKIVKWSTKSIVGAIRELVN